MRLYKNKLYFMGYVAVFFLFWSSGSTAAEPEPSFQKEETTSFVMGKLADITFDPSYIWIQVGKDTIDRVSWLYGETVFIDSQEKELSPRDFLEYFRGKHISVRLKEPEKKALVVEFVES